MIAEFGAIILLFVIGLEFDIKKMLKFGLRSIIVALMKNAFTIFLGYEVSVLLGFSPRASLFLGVILAFSSTVVIVKVLEQKEMFQRKEVPFLISILIIEDIIAVIAISFFSGVRNSSAGLLSSIEHIFLSLVIMAIAYIAMLRLIRYVIKIVSKSQNEDYITFLSLALCGSFSYFAFFLGLSPSAGAFVAGSIVASLPNSKSYATAMGPYVLIFTSIFFISIGTLVDFGAILPNLYLILALIAVVFITRLLIFNLLTSIFVNFRGEQSIFSGIVMLSIGEFSLLIAKESTKFNLGIDLVTITSVIIFITAVIMSLSVNHMNKLSHFFTPRLNQGIGRKINSVSEKIRMFFDHIEIESFFTKKLKSEIKTSFFWLGILLAFAFVARRYLSKMISSINIGVITYTSHFLSVALTFVLLFAALAFPFVMFLENLGVMYNVLPFVLIAISAFVLYQGTHSRNSQYANSSKGVWPFNT